MEKDEFLKALGDLSQREMSAPPARDNAMREEGPESVPTFGFSMPIDEEETRPPMPDIPLNGFMDDSLLTLIYTSPYQLPYEYKSVHEALIQVANESEPWRVRVDAALTIGRFVADQQDAYPKHKLSVYREPGNPWFQFARDLGSPAGAMACAEDLLDTVGLRVALDFRRDPLPRLVATEGRAQKALPDAVIHEWLHAIGLIATASEERLTEWTSKDWTGCLAAIVNYLCIVPQTSFTRKSDVASDTQEWSRRLDALSWVKPLWDTVLKAMESNPNVIRPIDQKMQALRAQQHFIIMKLRHQVRSQHPALAQDTVRASIVENLTEFGSTDQDQVVVVTTPIPTTADKEDRAILQQYQKLREPLPLVELPSMEQILFIRQQLLGEFPWATQAIHTVMSDLIARKRMGARRLGMTPVLLAGPPGAGKTRFAKRLGDLLETASLVLGLAGMSDVKVLKGLARGWSSARPSRILEFILQTGIPNSVIILDEVDKTGQHHQGGNPQDALLDLLEPANASRYQDIYLMASCNLEHCLYVLTSNSTDRLSEPLKSRLRPVYFPSPGAEHASVIIDGVVSDLEKAWGLPTGTITLTLAERQALRGLSPRELRFAVIDLLGNPMIKSVDKLH